ncbi:hypothetical protein CLAIMM_05272 isoform 3 [Cladophialophora immunda]|nr:hypothetical protein CLAIMM_05272 isoform 1 [Cladophialophora immunda]OQU99669.1 hypothetical protein CLAIMM_05272 isoform 3 [Cladophialophora immunda]
MPTIHGKVGGWVWTRLEAALPLRVAEARAGTIEAARPNFSVLILASLGQPTLPLGECPDRRSDVPQFSEMGQQSGQHWPVATKTGRSTPADPINATQKGKLVNSVETLVRNPWTSLGLAVAWPTVRYPAWDPAGVCATCTNLVDL